MERMPTVTAGRVLAHYVSSLEVDIPRLVAFYEALPFANKPPIDECHIHFSPLAIRDGARIFKGVHLLDSDPRQLDYLAPPTANIVVFVGSHEQGEGATLSETVGHELAHFAARNAELHEAPSTEERVLDIEAALYRSGCMGGLEAMFFTLIGSVVAFVLWLIWDLNPIPFMVTFLAVYLLRRFLGRRRRREYVYNVEKRSNELYRARASERSARDHADLDEAAVRISLREGAPPIFERSRSGRSLLSKVNYVNYRLLASQPVKSKETEHEDSNLAIPAGEKHLRKS